ncbi:MAG: class I SAM-dependent methyltransferase [Melioribacteraceae bacterium]|nr:class I SAM-dependent methyltransferase [Melioribacteraceae bacterium]
MTKDNYKNISDVYDLRYASNNLEEINIFIQNAINKFNPKNILEIGCGTCYWLSKLEHNSKLTVGLDLSRSMLNVALKKLKSSHLINGNAEIIPLKTNSFDFIFCVNALHFFSNTNKFFYDSFQLLKNNGILLLVFIDIHSSNNEFYFYNYFDGVKEKDEKRFLQKEVIINLLKENNYKILSIDNVEHISRLFYGEEVFSDPFLNKEQSSQLAFLTNEVYQKGLIIIRKQIKLNPEKSFRTEITFWGMTAQKINRT